MTQLPTTNQAATIANTAVDILNKVLVSAAEEALHLYVPETALPVVKQITDFIIEKADAELEKYEKQGVTFLVINIQTGVEGAAFKKARDNLAQAQKSGDKDAIAKAMADFKEAVAGLAHTDGSADVNA